MKYWRGYLTAAIFAAFTWGLMRFAESHAVVVDMVYPYVTRMIQTMLAQWSSGVDFCLWQLIAVLLGVAVLASIVLMIVLRWNPIQWFGWILATASVLFFLHTGIYGLNTYAGALADDIQLNITEYTLQELKEATIYYRDQANVLSTQVSRDGSGDLAYPSFEELAEQAGDGFENLTYEQCQPVFAGSTLPVKKLGWADMYTSMGITGVSMPLTGEAAVNPQIPEVSLPFTMCHEMAHRMSIAIERDANFAAFLACKSNSSVEFRYSAYFMAYRYCYNALYRTGGSAMVQEVSSGVGELFQKDLTDYSNFYATHQDEKATKTADKVNDTYIKASGDSQGVASYGDVCDLLVSWHIQEIVLPSQVVEESAFDPTDASQVDISDILGRDSAQEPSDDNGGE